MLKGTVHFISGCLLAMLVLLCVTSNGYAQTSHRAEVNNFISTVNSHIQNQEIEKIYLQTDKPAYTTGDTLWFKAYIFDAAFLSASTKSGIMYIELANDSNRLMKRIMVPVYKGLTFGNITLDGSEMPQGGYTLRAYTNWLRNFGESGVFQKRFYLSNTTQQDWLIDYNTKLSRLATKENIQLNLRFNELDKVPVRLREMQMRLTDGRRTWFKTDVQTDLEGIIKANFDLPDKANAKSLSLRIQDMRKGQGNRQLLIPVILNRPGNIDLQFMPEGGHMVAALPTQVAFKALNEDGLAASITGTVYNSKNQPVASLATAYKGMGVFDFVPQAGENYYAKIATKDSSLKVYPLPAVVSTGSVLGVINPNKGDSCEVRINASPDVLNTNNTYYLLGMARGIICYTASFRFNGRAARFGISKQTFPTGVVRFLLTTTNKVTLNERMIYIDHADNLNIRITSNKSVYHQRDSAALNIEVTDYNGSPVQGNFSLAVTDDAQVKNDSITSNNLISQILLTSNLKGNIETPGYYANADSSIQKWQRLDYLLLCQGWTGYDWTNAFKPAANPVYASEKTFAVTGKVTNLFNKPVAKSGVTLLSKKPFFIADTSTNEQGIFTFTGITPSDTAAYFIQAKNKKGKSFNVGIQVNEFTPPVFTAFNERMMPWYVNIDTSKFTSLKKQAELKRNQEIISRGTLLKEVEVKAKKIVKGSKNLNGPGEADIIIDEEELGKAGRTSLGDLLQKRVKGFGLTTKSKRGVFTTNYMINNLLVHLIIDGIELDFYYQEDSIMPRWEFYKQYMDYYDAEEIKGIEVMTSGKYQMTYTSAYLDPLETFFDHTFIEVTTRSGHGPFVRKPVGTYVYKPMPFSLPKFFYAPKYKAESVPNMTDIRSTVHWEPVIATNEDGKATVSFYTADNPGTYTVIMEGSDMDGKLGIKQTKLTVVKQVAN